MTRRIHYYSHGMRTLYRVFTSSMVALLALGCGSTGNSSTGGPGSGLVGTAFQEPFAGRDTLLVHPQTWKSAGAGSTAILVSDTPDLCAQITSGKTSAPGVLVVVSFEERSSAGTVVDLDVGSFVTDGQGTPSSRYGEVFLSRVDAKCSFGKLFTDRSEIEVTTVGPNSSPVTTSVKVHFTNGDALEGMVSADKGCDEAAVDHYLNGNPTCG